MNTIGSEEIRARLLEQRRGLSAKDREVASTRVAPVVADHLERSCAGKASPNSRYIAVYQPIGGEIDPIPAARMLFERGWPLALPRCVEDVAMDFCSWEPGDSLAPGPYGIAEPLSPALELQALAAVIVPGVGFDRSGNRIGHGVGFYDRFFARLAQHGYHPYRLGLAYDFQLVSLPTPETWDIPVHSVVTPSELIDPAS